MVFRSRASFRDLLASSVTSNVDRDQKLRDVEAELRRNTIRLQELEHLVRNVLGAAREWKDARSDAGARFSRFAESEVALHAAVAAGERTQAVGMVKSNGEEKQ